LCMLERVEETSGSDEKETGAKTVDIAVSAE
jgi:hypothetical protein